MTAKVDCHVFSYQLFERKSLFLKQNVGNTARQITEFVLVLKKYAKCFERKSGDYLSSLGSSARRQGFSQLAITRLNKDGRGTFISPNRITYVSTIILTQKL